MLRRDAIGAAGAAALGVASGACKDPAVATPAPSGAPSSSAGSTASPDASRLLGKTGLSVGAFSLGGEGVLRTHGRAAEAVPVILEALRLGVRYCDTAPAYASSQDYYGAAFREAGKAARDGVVLASKTHLRDRDGSLRLLDDSLRRLGTDRLDVWQLHDLRTREDLDEIFGKGGAIEAVERARSDGRVRLVGITGHHDPDILLEAMRRYPVDTLLAAMNPADPRKLPFLTSVVPAARERGVAVIGMKVLGRGDLVDHGVASHAELIRYAATHADTVIIGCKSPAEVRANVEAARALSPMSGDELRSLEARVAPKAHLYDTFKA